MKKRILSAILALCFVFALLPTFAFAEDTATYTAISTTEELTTGQYVMAVATGYGPSVLDGTWVLAEVITAVDGVVTNPTATTVWTITVSADGVKLTDSNGVTIAPSGGNTNGIKSGDYTWTVSCTDGAFRFGGVGNDTVLLTSNKGSSNRFRAYKSTTAGSSAAYPCDFTLYKLSDGSVTPEPTDPTPTDPTPTEPEPTEAPTEPTIVSISEAIAGADGTSFTVKGVITCLDGSNVYVQDATGGICVRMSSGTDGLSLGDTIIGTGSKTTYRGMPQLGSSTYELSEGMTLTAKETTIDALTTADVCCYVKLSGLTVTEVYDNDGAYTAPNVTVSDGTNSIQIYKAVVGKTNGTDWDIAVNDIVDVTAAVGIYNDTLQLRNTLATEIVKVGTVEPEPTEPEPTEPEPTEPEPTEPVVPVPAEGTLVYENGHYYYYLNEEIQYGAGLIYLDENYYYICSAGYAVTGAYYITNTNGLLPEGLQVFGDDGKMYVANNSDKNGIYLENGQYYYYVAGQIQFAAGLIQIENDYYYIRSNGTAAIGTYWVTNTNDLMEEGFQVFGADGKMYSVNNSEKNGIYLENGQYYYYVAGQIQFAAGLIQIENDYYYIRSNGAAAIGAYWISNTNGLMEEGFYVFGEDGKMIQE